MRTFISLGQESLKDWIISSPDMEVFKSERKHTGIPQKSVCMFMDIILSYERFKVNQDIKVSFLFLNMGYCSIFFL